MFNNKSNAIWYIINMAVQPLVMLLFYLYLQIFIQFICGQLVLKNNRRCVINDMSMNVQIFRNYTSYISESMCYVTTDIHINV